MLRIDIPDANMSSISSSEQERVCVVGQSCHLHVTHFCWRFHSLDLHKVETQPNASSILKCFDRKPNGNIAAQRVYRQINKKLSCGCLPSALRLSHMCAQSRSKRLGFPRRQAGWLLKGWRKHRGWVRMHRHWTATGRSLCSTEQWLGPKSLLHGIGKKHAVVSWCCENYMTEIFSVS